MVGGPPGSGRGLPGEPGQLVIGGCGAGERVVLTAERMQVGDGRAQLTARGGGALSRRARAAGGQPRYRSARQQQAAAEHRAGRRQQDQARAHRAGPDDGGGQRRRDPADEQVLSGVHVADQAG